jgi:GAF domain-containing protein
MEVVMKKQQKNYETLLKITNAISHSKDPQEIALMTVESIKTALHVKGCTLFLVNRKTHGLVSDDPRLQYPEEAKKEGIASILSVPIVSGGNVIGALRIYTSQHWEFTLEDVNFVQALAQIVGMAINRSRLYQGQKESIHILKKMVRTQTRQTAKRTPPEGVSVSIPSGENSLT